MNDTADSPDSAAANVTAKPAQATNDEDGNSILWRASPGQVVHLPLYCVVVVLAAIPAIYAPGVYAFGALLPLAVCAWYVIATRCIRYTLTEQLLRRRSGVLNRRVEEIELYRVEDTSAVAPLLYRLYGRGNVEISSNDESTPKLTLRAIRQYDEVRHQIRDRVEAMRQSKGARLVESE
ncbi:PH domain-containing protein [Salinisphaera orenii]|uniref:PH domain-containing protein n=1 Tax=Salinisphaera orenii TaxID=856731 RepID=UPI000DBE1A5C